jgi:hypothetical protein
MRLISGETTMTGLPTSSAVKNCNEIFSQIFVKLILMKNKATKYQAADKEWTCHVLWP